MSGPVPFGAAGPAAGQQACSARVPGTFAGEGYAGIYDVNQQPKAAYYALQSDLALAAYGAPHRVRTYQSRA